MAAEKVNKNDFVEIEFTGKSDGNIFDTTNSDEAKTIGIDAKDINPMIISVGNGMMLQGFDEELAGKEIGKKYGIHLSPEKAFGKRNPSLIRTYPLKAFSDRKINPYPGLVLQLDNSIAKVISVSGGRVMIDFNNPLAGKEIDYEYKILRKVEDDKEKINSLQDFFFKQRFEFSIDNSGKNKKAVFNDLKIKPIIDIFSQKFREISGIDVGSEPAEEKKEEKKSENGKSGEKKEKTSAEKKSEEEKNTGEEKEKRFKEDKN